MNKIIAIPLENGVLCAHFGHCQTFAIVAKQTKPHAKLTGSRN